MRRRLFVKSLVVMLYLSVFCMIASHGYAVSKIPVISKEELKMMLDDPGVIVIDVRVEGRSSELKIKGAVWEDPDRVDSWAGKYPKDKTMVLYCS